MPHTDVDQAKRAVRERVWALLERECVVERGVRGRIPAFSGADEAAERLATLPSWQAAHVVKAVPDTAQLPVRALALAEGKLVYMAVPKLVDELPFYLLDPATLTVPPAEAAAVHQMLPVDFVICGSVAVNRQGVRLGKGAGYSDIEIALLVEAGLVTPNTTIATTVHSLQVVDEQLPEAGHDFSLDVIITPDEIIPCPQPGHRPAGLIWDNLSSEKITAIPILAARATGER
jgi:5-formyltetrahydrofolate cyclo-ligase